MRLPATILVLIAAIAVAVAAQDKPPKIVPADGSDTRKLTDLIAEFETSARRKVHSNRAPVSETLVACVTPHNHQPTEVWLRMAIEGALLRTGHVLRQRDDGDLEIARQADAKPRVVTEAELTDARDTEWVRASVAVSKDWRPALNPTDLRCQCDLADGTMTLTGYARDVRTWRREVVRMMELEQGVTRTYPGLALNTASVKTVVRTLFPEEATVTDSAEGPVITAAPGVHNQLEGLLPRK